MRLCADSRVLQDTSMGESMGESLGSVRWTIGVGYRDVLSRCANAMGTTPLLLRGVGGSPRALAPHAVLLPAPADASHCQCRHK